ncbi:uncharacterized protein PF11_0213-like isoform X2 [Vespa mandarinia]|uniref:uncharacterized protein PF11_0213-like isoform X2 n=1 Tax=Vespa mandarinia TaxID=7446 RepID=UPI001609E515|nr:uncharacterized protein PF11_0213-like isoform X2 [Vespa mandarinia]
MKGRWNCSKEELVSAEEGLKINKSVTRRKSYCYERFIQYVKLILLILLISFVGWSSYTIWKVYSQESIDLSGLGSSSTQYNDDESSTISNRILSLSLSKSEKTLETTTRQSILLNDDLFPSEIYSIDNQMITTMKIPESSIKQDISITSFENTVTEETIKNSFKSSINDHEEEITMPTLNKNETKEYENSADESVIEWSFPFIRSIYGDTDSITDDYLEEIRNAELDALLKELDESNEKDEESNEFSKFQENSFEKEDLSDDQNDENNRSYEKDVPSSIEIINNLKKLHDSIDAMIKDLHVENRQSDYDLLKSEESSIKDESSNHLVLGLDRQLDSIETPSSISGEDSEITKSSLFHDSLIEEDPYRFLLGNHDHSYLESSILSSLERVDSEKSDTSKVDDTTSDLKKGYLENMDKDLWLYRQDNKREDSDIETNPTDKSTERHLLMDVSTPAIVVNDDDIIRIVEPWIFYVNSPVFSSMNNVNLKKEIVFTNSRNEDPNKGVICTIQTLNRINLLKCSSNSFDTSESFTEQSNDGSFESSSHFIPDSKSDIFTEEDNESFSNHYSSSVESHTTDNSLDDMTSSNKNIDIKASTIEQESKEISIDSTNSESEMSDISSERWMKFESPTDTYDQDNTSKIIEDPILWWLDVNKYRTKRSTGEETIERKRRGIAKIMSGQKTFSDDEDLYGKWINDKTRLQDWIWMHETEIIKNMIREYSNEELDENIAKLYSKMEILSSHIDMLHELYLRRHNLEDDYISQEFLNDSYEN